MLSDWKSVRNFSDIFYYMPGPLWISQSIKHLEDPAVLPQLYYPQTWHFSDQDVHILPYKHLLVLSFSPPGEVSQVPSAINVGFTQEPTILPHWTSHGVIKLTSAAWGWSALTVVGLWSGEESRAWRAFTYGYYSYYFGLPSFAAAACQDADWVKEEEEGLLFLISRLPRLIFIK